MGKSKLLFKVKCLPIKAKLDGELIRRKLDNLSLFMGEFDQDDGDADFLIEELCSVIEDITE